MDKNINKKDSKEKKNKDKNQYGIVYTPTTLVNKILDLIPPKYFQDPSLTWLDLGAGKGAFTINLYDRLFKNLEPTISDLETRKNHIIKNMIFMVEIFPDHIIHLKEQFGKDANIITEDFLSLNKYEYEPFDFIIGNPPYNTNGQIKTPTNTSQKKTDDGKAIYVDFVKKSLTMLTPGGFLNLIIPSLWLKPDKAGLYKTLTNLPIHKLHCLSTSETNKLFNYQAQTPTCFFLCGREIALHAILSIFDKSEQTYIPYNLKPDYPIPTHGITIINKLLPYVEKYGHLEYYKTNTASKKSIISINPTNTQKYKNIQTCYLDGLTPGLVENYSNIPQKFYKQPKLILAHKMYGFPYLDISGEYGISTRDNYIINGKAVPYAATKEAVSSHPATSHAIINIGATNITSDYSLEDLLQIQAFLSTKFALFIFSTTNYRMRYLERYAFLFIPAITRIQHFPSLKNMTREERDKTINNFFNFSPKENSQIENSSKNYNFFI